VAKHLSAGAAGQHSSLMQSGRAFQGLTSSNNTVCEAKHEKVSAEIRQSFCRVSPGFHQSFVICLKVSVGVLHGSCRLL